MIEKILIAVAGRGLCEQMLNVLVEIPAIQRASITILHVAPNQASAEGMAEKLEEGGKILATAIKSLKVSPEQITSSLQQGDPKDIVCQVAEKETPDLIIMGSRGLGRIESLLENSVSQYVFQLTTRPLLLVKDDVYVKRLNRVMVAIDGSDASQNALKQALFFLRDLKGSKLVLVHINPDKTVTNPEQDPVLASAVAQVRQMGISYTCVNSNGKPGEEICKLAQELNVDLLIVGSPERRPSVAKGLVDLDRLIGSSQSDYVRVHASCPVLLSR